MKLVFIFYIVFLVFLAALIITILTDGKLLINKKQAVSICLFGTIMYGILFFLAFRLEWYSYNYPVAVSSTSDNKIDDNNIDKSKNIKVKDNSISKKENSKVKEKESKIKEKEYVEEKEKGLIKGNINKRTKEKIYHVPGSTYYDRTIAEEWFKTIEEAEKAGYRAPKR